MYTNVSTGVINYLITDWHGIASFNLYDEGELNYYVDTNIGCSAYCLMANSNVWAGLSDDLKAKIESVSGRAPDYVHIGDFSFAVGGQSAEIKDTSTNDVRYIDFSTKTQQYCEVSVPGACESLAVPDLKL